MARRANPCRHRSRRREGNEKGWLHSYGRRHKECPNRHRHKQRWAQIVGRRTRRRSAAMQVASSMTCRRCRRAGALRDDLLRPLVSMTSAVCCDLLRLGTVLRQPAMLKTAPGCCPDNFPSARRSRVDTLSSSDAPRSATARLSGISLTQLPRRQW